jgi:hypothetical protein
MTEAEWLACVDPVRLLDHLNRPQGDRKLSLFAVACCRAIWQLLPQPEMRKGVELAEWLAEGKATEEEREAADWELEGALYGGVEYYAERPEIQVPEEIARWVEDVRALPTDHLAVMACAGGEDLPTDLLGLLKDAGYFAVHVLNMNSFQWHSPTLRWHRRFLNLHLLREIFGNPFRPVAINPAWLTTNVTALAQAIYEERAFDCMPILGDALEDAGCNNALILEHCRSGREHVRGCWVVDLVLGKE